MIRKQFNLRIIILLILTITMGTYCSKKDVSQKQLEPSNLENITSGNNVTSSKQKDENTNEKNKPKKHPKEKPLPVSKEEQIITNMNSTGYTYFCGGMINGEYYDLSNYTYPPYSMNFDNLTGGMVTLELYPFETPNQFTVLNPYGQIVAQSAWMGTAGYSGPWGNSLNGETWGELALGV
ncbi:MAG: hypothetical protein ACR2KB_09920 [Chitinophagaceae bacterium]